LLRVATAEPGAEDGESWHRGKETPSGFRGLQPPPPLGAGEGKRRGGLLLAGELHCDFVEVEAEEGEGGGGGPLADDVAGAAEMEESGIGGLVF
jgi:hypothetical protein